MTLGNNEQIFKLVEESKNILIITDPNFNTDNFSGSLSFALFLQKLDKNVTVYFKNDIEKKYEFLNGFNFIKNTLELKNNLIIAISTKNTKAKELSYEPKDDKIEIYLTPEKNKTFTKEDVMIIDNQNSFDLIISIGIDNIKNIGEFYDNNVEFFFNTTTINIDNNPENERFGQINFIEPKYKSICELIFDITTIYKSELIDEKIATNMLTGIIYKNKGFKIPDLSPNTMEAVSNLIDIGANRQDIVNNLYKTKTVNDLRIWAKILQNSKLANNNEIFLSSIDDENEQINFSDLFNEIISNIDGIKIGLLFNKINDIIYIDLLTNNNINAKDLLSELNPVGDKDEIKFAISSSEIDKVIEIILQKILKKIQ